MKITCPNCAAEYNISEGKIPAGGLQIKCPKCLHSFLAHRDGSTTSAAAARPTGGFGRAAPPPPPPPGGRPPPPPGSRPPAAPPGFGSQPPPPPPAAFGGGAIDLAVDVVDEIEDLEESGSYTSPGAGHAATAAMPAAGGAVDDFDFGFGSSSTGSIPAAAERTAADVDDFDFSFGGDSLDGGAGRSQAQADDFDFSFGGSAPPPEPRSAGGGRLGDLFDDLEDLPAPKMDPYADLPGERGFTDLPGERGFTDLPGERGFTDLPGERGFSGLPGERGVEGLPTERGASGLPAERGASGLPTERGSSGLPTERGASGLPTERGASGLPTEKGASGLPGDVLIAPEDHGPEPPPGAAPADVEARPDAPAAPGGRKRILIIAAAVAATLVLAVGGLMVAGVGPFGEDTPPPRRTTVSKKPKKPVPPPPPPVPSEPGVPDEDGMIPTSGATLAEVAGYRDAIGRLEPSRADLKGEAAIELIELYAFGALEFPGNARWAESASALLSQLGEETGSTPAGRRATLAAALAEGNADVIPKIIEHADAQKDDARTRYLAGHAHLAKGEVGAALGDFRTAVTADDTLIGARRMAGELALKAGELDTARKDLEALYTVAAGAPSVLNALAAIEVQEKSYDRAGKLLEQALALPPERLSGQAKSRALLIRARMYLAQDDEAKAIIDLEGSARAWPQNLEALDLLSDRQFATGNFEKALDQLETLRGAGVDSPQIAIKIAQCHEGLNRSERALRVLEKAVEDFPDDPMVHTALGDLHLAGRAFEPARTAYEKALEVDAKHQPAQLKMAELLVKEAKVDAAIDYLKKARKKNPDGAMILVGIADLNKRLAETSNRRDLYAEAEKDYRAALKIDPSLNSARRDLVTVLLATDKAEAALGELEHLDRRPDFHEPLDFDLGRAKQSMGRTDEAIAHFDAALKRDGEKPIVLLHAGSARFEKGEFEAAGELLDKAVEADSKLIDGHYYLGRVAYAQDRFPAAIQHFKQALELDKRNYPFHYWLGRALESAGEDAQLRAARQEYDVVADQAAQDPRLAAELCDTFVRRGRMRMKKFAEWQGAIDDFGRAIKCDKEGAEAWFLRGQMKDRTNDLDGAIRDFGQAIKRAPEMGEAYAASAAVHLRKRPPNIKKIEKLSRKAVKLDDTIAEPHYTLCTLLKERSKASARRHCERYVELAPNGDNAPIARDLLRSL